MSLENRSSSVLSEVAADVLQNRPERELGSQQSRLDSAASDLHHSGLADAMRAARPHTLAPSLEGSALAGGRIRVGRRIGGGAMGVVHEAVDGSRDVAIKVLHRLQELQVYRLKTEFRRLVQLDHPNVVCVYELFNEGVEWFFSMQRVQGLPLHRYVEGRYFAASEGVYETDFRSLLRQLIEGIAAIHEAGLVHRDIKPTNVLVTSDGRLVIIDFGLVSEQFAGGVGQTIDNRISGTLGYIAPELLRGAPATAASDCYALGATLHQLLSGRVPQADPEGDALEPPSKVLGGLPDDLRALCARLLSVNPAARPTIEELLELCADWTRPQQRLSMPPSAPRELFVGRAEELNAIQQAASRARQASASIALIRGASGMGKSALLRRFVLNMRAEGAVALDGRCSEWESVPYKGLDEVIDRLSRLAIKMPHEQAAHLVPRHAAAVVRVFPALLRVEAFSMAAENSPEGEEEEWLLRRHAVMGIKDTFYRLAERHRIVVVIDDLQWADADTVQLLADLLSAPAPPNLFLIASVTEGTSSDELVADLARAAAVDSFVLGPLDPEDSRELAMALLPEDQKDPALVERMVRESQGIPLYLAELAELPDGSFQASDAGKSPLLSQVLLPRIERLSPAARHLLELVAVAVRPMTLCIADSCGAEDVQSSLRQLMAQRLVCSVALSGQELGFEPYTEHVRHVLMHVMPDGRVAQLHAALVRALEALPDAEPEWLLAHYRGAGTDEQARRYSVIVAERALAVLAFERAASMFMAALELTHEQSPDWIELNVSCANALVKAGRSSEAARAYERAARGAPSEQQAFLRNSAVTHWIRSGHIVEGVALLRSTLEAVGIAWPETSAQAMLKIVSQRTLIRIRGLACKPRPEAEVPRELLQKIDALHPAQTALGAFDYLRGATFAAIALPLALKAREPKRLVVALAGEAIYGTMLDGLGGERRGLSVQRQIEDLRAHGTGHYERAIAAIVSSMCCYWTGRWKDVLAPAALAESLLRKHVAGALWESSLIRSIRHTVLLHRGRQHEFAKELPDELAYASVRDDRYAYLDLLRRSISVHLANDEVPEALDALDRLSNQRRQYPFLAFDHLILSSVVATLLYAGKVTEARAEFDARAAECRRAGMDRLPLVRLTLIGMEADCVLADESEPDVARARRLVRLGRSAARVRVAWAPGLAAVLLGAAAELSADPTEAAVQFRIATGAFENAGLDTAGAAARWRSLRTIERDAPDSDVSPSEKGRRSLEHPEGWLRAVGIKRPERWVGIVHSLY